MAKKKNATTDEAASGTASNHKTSSIYVFTDSAYDLPKDVAGVAESVRIDAASTKRFSMDSARMSETYAAANPTAELDTLKPDLNRWDIQVHKYEDKTKAKAGFLGFGGVEAELLEAGLVQEAKRFLVKKTDQGRHVEFGVSVRLWIAVTKYDFKVDLTVPNLAASAQISQTNARIGLSVAGFSGALGELLPSPESLNVTNFPAYLDAFRDIQAHVFGDGNEDKLSPVLLGFFESTTR